MDGLREKNINILKSFIIILGSVNLLFSLKHYFINPSFPVAKITWTIALLTAIPFFLFLKKKYRAASSILSWLAFFECVLVYYIRPEFVSPVLLWIVMLPFLSVPLVGFKEGWIQYAVLMISLLVIAYLKNALPLAAGEESSLQVLKDFQINLLIAPLASMCFVTFLHFYKDQALKTINQQKEEIASAFLEKKKLLSIMSHDMSNLVTAVDGRVTLALMKKDPEKSRECVEKAAASLRLMKELLFQVRNLQSYGDGKIDFSLAPTRIRSLCEKVELIFQDQLLAKNLHFSYDEVEDLSVMVEPVSFLSCVLSNLVSNSIKFSKEDSDILLSSQTDSRGHVSLVCQDFGVGIPNEKINDLFFMERKTTSLGTSGEKGTGYGLPIAKEIMKLHGGDIVISSVAEGEARGTRSVLTLNIAT